MPSVHSLPTFKSLLLGAKFSRDGQTFKKVKGGAYLVLDSGTSQTHTLLPFARNSRVKPVV